ncbi:MAG: hypothetical protein RIR11_183 [Bacteroidota bacterium]
MPVLGSVLLSRNMNIEIQGSRYNATVQSAAMRRYYRLHAIIYDATRWSFLWGRNQILKQIPIEKTTNATFLEIGCGTGRNLNEIANQFPSAQLLGIDVSRDMLEKAAKTLFQNQHRVQLLETAYPSELPTTPQVILYSYALTMFNPGWEAAIEQAWKDLPVGGYIAIVDFHDTPFKWMERWMGFNHVRMDGHLLPFAATRFSAVHQSVHKTYFGWWRYFMYVGQKTIADTSAL